MTTAWEVNFDGLVGPTHNYAGLSYGNLASTKHRHTVSNPRAAALEGLAKAKFVRDLGLRQAVLPPQERPHLSTLRRMGFSGTDAQILERAHREAPALLAAVCSSSSMWAANAATVSPSADCADGRVHFTPANLVSTLHRSIEATTTCRVLSAIFADRSAFEVHSPLPASMHFSDEGAANHTRLCGRYHERGFEVFTYGRLALDPAHPAPRRFPARQTHEASAELARLHGLEPSRVVMLQQHPEAIDAGAFHNDVVAVGNLDVMLYHERSYVDDSALHRLPGMRLIKVREEDVPLAEAVSTYVFNCQLVSPVDGTMELVAPVECRENARVRSYLDSLLRGEITAVHYVDVRQSMQNGGGPACLRLRVVLNERELALTHAGVMLTDELYDELCGWVVRNYRTELHAGDLADPKLLDESRIALDELTRILGLGNVYEFQQ